MQQKAPKHFNETVVFVAKQTEERGSLKKKQKQTEKGVFVIVRVLASEKNSQKFSPK